MHGSIADKLQAKVWIGLIKLGEVSVERLTVFRARNANDDLCGCCSELIEIGLQLLPMRVVIKKAMTKARSEICKYQRMTRLNQGLAKAVFELLDGPLDDAMANLKVTRGGSETAQTKECCKKLQMLWILGGDHPASLLSQWFIRDSVHTPCEPMLPPYCNDRSLRFDV